MVRISHLVIVKDGHSFANNSPEFKTKKLRRLVLFIETLNFNELKHCQLY